MCRHSPPRRHHSRRCDVSRLASTLLWETPVGGSEGRPNAGFVVTDSGVVVIDALASPRQAEELVHAIRRVTTQPIKWLILTHHHPDHHFGAIVFRRLGAKVIAHPDRRVLASEAGEDALMANWVRVVGLDAMRGLRVR